MQLSGVQNEIIKSAQIALNARGFGPLVVDGLNGPKTIAAVKAFQSKNGLAVDGIIGPKTAAALAAPIKTDNTPLAAVISASHAATQNGVAYSNASPPALPTGTVAPLPAAPQGTVYAPPPQIVEIAAPAAPAQGGVPLPLLFAGAAALAILAMG